MNAQLFTLIYFTKNARFQQIYAINSSATSLDLGKISFNSGNEWMKTEARLNNSRAPSDVTLPNLYTFFPLAKWINEALPIPFSRYITETDSPQSAQVLINFQTPENLKRRPEISHWESGDINEVKCILHLCPACSITFKTDKTKCRWHFQMQVQHEELKANGKRCH